VKIIILTNQYPNYNDPYRNGFVHQRAINYIKYGCSVRVFFLSKIESEYEYEGIKVVSGESKLLVEHINRLQDHVITIHFINRHIIKLLNKLSNNLKITVFFHGVEALHWKRRMFELGTGFFKYVIAISNHLFILKRFLKNNNELKFVFVSDWMMRVAKKDLKIDFKNYAIIPNVINTDIFYPDHNKNIEFRRNILIIRHFGSRKYANDIALKALKKVLDSNSQLELMVNIYGKGKYFKKLTKNFHIYPNVKIFNKFVNHEEIKKLHNQSGIFLCPTRQDSQGVSMCEAMASGLVPITSNNTAIPEFVSEKSGFLSDNTVDSISKAILIMVNNPNLYKFMSINASEEIVSKCAPENVIPRELEFISWQN
jgi:L-malate glycosyltransferase